MRLTASAIGQAAPPPTRRCAVGAAGLPVGDRGSSAHAEMRPSSACAGRRSTRLLRPRGDAPETRRHERTQQGAPPPTRRCADAFGVTPESPHGSSAHAEMRPRPRRPSRALPRLLRPRGDAPSRRRLICAPASAPPPTRRCARRRWPHHLTTRGLLRPRGDAPLSHCAHSISNPAPPPTRRCAAFGSCSTFGATGLLRPRGDAPAWVQWGTTGVGAPPPTRRCAPCARRRAPRTRGSSAHAEMRPRPPQRRTSPPWLLRPRGDAPYRGGRPSPRPRAPPPTRRCARSRGERAAQRHGSSAHAEMRPRRDHRARATARLLRPRGDAPPAARRRGDPSRLLRPRGDAPVR